MIRSSLPLRSHIVHHHGGRRCPWAGVMLSLAAGALMLQTMNTTVPKAPLLNDNRFKLCLFASNVTGGLTISTAEGVNDPNWPEQLRLARIVDQAGFEALIPVCRWIGFGGASQFMGKTFETFTWAAGLGGQTSYTMVVATGHVPALHPIVAAKQSVTVDHITGGRFGVNLVAGWFKSEMELFGAKLLDHDRRYAQAAEWIQLVKRLWLEEGAFDYEGQFYNLTGAEAQPKPLQEPRPVVINAGISPRGQRFAAEHADVGFIMGEDIPELANNARTLRAVAGEEFGREIVVLADVVVVCFPTDAEAQAYAKLVGDKGDTEAAENNMRIMRTHSKVWTDEQYARFGRRFMQSYGCAQAVGSPRTVADYLIELCESGVDGVAFSFMGFWEDNLRRFSEEVIPLLEQADLRRPHRDRLNV